MKLKEGKRRREKEQQRARKMQRGKWKERNEKMKKKNRNGRRKLVREVERRYMGEIRKIWNRDKKVARDEGIERKRVCEKRAT